MSTTAEPRLKLKNATRGIDRIWATRLPTFTYFWERPDIENTFHFLRQLPSFVYSNMQQAFPINAQSRDIEYQFLECNMV